MRQRRDGNGAGAGERGLAYEPNSRLSRDAKEKAAQTASGLSLGSNPQLRQPTSSNSTHYGIFTITMLVGPIRPEKGELGRGVRAPVVALTLKPEMSPES